MSRYFKGGQGLGLATDVAALKITDEFTVHCWAKVNKWDLQFNQNTLMAKGPTGSFFTCLLSLIHDGTVSANSICGTTGVGATCKGPMRGDWIAVGGVFSMANAKVEAWMNGTFARGAVSGGASFVADTHVWMIGERSDGATNFCYHNGWISHVAIWHASLTAPEMRSLANGTSPLRVRAANLVAYWPLEEPNGLADLSGGGNTLASVAPGSGAIPASQETPTFPNKFRPLRRIAYTPAALVAINAPFIPASGTVFMASTSSAGGTIGTLYGQSVSISA